MYTFLLDGKTLYYPGDELCTLTGDPEIKLAIGQAGSCELTIPPNNPLYGSVQLRKSMLTVMRDNTEVFCGEVREATRDRDNCLKVYAVGELAFLQDGIQPQHYYGDVTPTNFMQSVLNVHNGIVEERKHFSMGYTTVTSGYDRSAKVTDRNTTLDALREQLVGNLGGCLRIRKQNGTRYLDYVTLSDYGSANGQGINFGENLLDYSETLTASDIVTCIVPLGKRIDSAGDSQGDFEARVDIKSVNNNLDYLTSSQTVLDKFGHIWKVVTFDDLESPAELKSAGQDWLTKAQYETLRLKVTAVDLSLLDSSMDSMKLGDRIPCKAEPYGLHITLPIIEQTIHPLSPQKDTIVLSATMRNNRQTISEQVGGGGSAIKQAAVQTELKIRNVIRQEMANIMASFAGEYGGYKLSEFDENGLWLRDLYMDAPDKEDATNIMELSMRGIRFSNAGYKSPTDSAWKLAMTIDGKFASQEIFSNIIFANLLKAGVIEDASGKTSWNLETGAFTMKKGSITLGTKLYIDDNGKIKSGTNESDEWLQIYGGYMTGLYGNSVIGYVDLSADYGSAGRKAVIGSNTDLMVEFKNRLSFVCNGVEVAYVDSSGVHT